MLLANPLTHPLSDSDSDCREPPRGARSLLARLGGAILREIRIRRSLRELDSLGDAMLHDLGVTRGGLEDVVRHGRAWDGRPAESRRIPRGGVDFDGRVGLTEWR